VQLGPDEADHEVVVELVEPVAGEPDVVPEPRPAERGPDAAVLHQDPVLLLPRELLERPRPAERVPDRPAELRVEDAPPRALDERVLQVLLVPDRIRPAEHRVLGLPLELGEGRRAQEAAELVHEGVRRLAQRDECDSPRVVRVLVQGAGDGGILERGDEPSGVGRAAERLELHEEPAVEGCSLACLRQAVLGDVYVVQGLLVGPVVEARGHSDPWSQRAASFAW
jgi:hypothetical protein